VGFPNRCSFDYPAPFGHLRPSCELQFISKRLDLTDVSRLLPLLHFTPARYTDHLRLDSSSDFLSNLLVLLLRIMNAGLSDSGLLTHLSEATAGSLSGVGHSSVYEDPGVFE